VADLDPDLSAWLSWGLTPAVAEVLVAVAGELCG
jgi:hypothetical protein